MIRIGAMAAKALEVVLGRFPGVPGRVFLTPGLQVPWDDCDGGLVAVRVIRIAPRMPQGAQPVGPNPMAQASGWVMRAAVQIVDCVATVDDLGNPPETSAVTAEAGIIWEAAEKALCALLLDLPKEYRCRIIEWVPLGPAGGMAGGEWVFEVEAGP